MKTSQMLFCEHIPKSKEKTYYERRFVVPENVCCIDIEYHYNRYDTLRQDDGTTIQTERNTVDLAIRDGYGNYIGASGAGRHHIHISAWNSSAGYACTNTNAGDWAVIIGAYRIADEGARVTYRITFTYKERTLLLGDIHTHTNASDGKLSLAELVRAAKGNGLDFLFVTDHNDYAQNFQISAFGTETFTVLPGMEWTHYNGHCGLLGVTRPVASPFCVNTGGQVSSLLREAQKNGALTVQNHPFCPSTGWQFDIDDSIFDLVEIMNGGTLPSANEACLRWWHDRLCQGRKIPIAGGSDYHGTKYGKNVGQPSTALYAMSLAPDDILSALRNGNGYVILWPGAPVLWAEAGQAILGETAPRGTEICITLTGLQGGDRLRIITNIAREEMICPEQTCQVSLHRAPDNADFIRFEVIRGTERILISNPIYFE